MHHTGLIVLFEGILAFEIESRFLEGPDEDLIEFILFSSTVSTSTNSPGIISPRCPFLEIEDRRRETGNDRPDMQHGWEIEIFEREPEKHFRHLRLHKARWSKLIGDLQILIENVLDGRSLSSSKDILGIVRHTHENTEEIFPGTRKFIASTAHSSGRTSGTDPLGHFCPVLRKFPVVAEGHGRIRIYPYEQLCLRIAQEVRIEVRRDLTGCRTPGPVVQKSGECQFRSGRDE